MLINSLKLQNVHFGNEWSEKALDKWLYDDFKAKENWWYWLGLVWIVPFTIRKIIGCIWESPLLMKKVFSKLMTEILGKFV